MNDTLKKKKSGHIDIDQILCDSCGLCVAVCPAYCLHMEFSRLNVDNSACIGCDICTAVCPVSALTLTKS